MRTLKISLSSFQIFNTLLLTIVTTLYITSPGLLSFISGCKACYLKTVKPVWKCRLCRCEGKVRAGPPDDCPTVGGPLVWILLWLRSLLSCNHVVTETRDLYFLWRRKLHERFLVQGGSQCLWKGSPCPVALLWAARAVPSLRTTPRRTVSKADCLLGHLVFLSGWASE